MILEFSSEAENDLEQIANYVAEHNPLRALLLIRELRSKCEYLVNSSNGFALVPATSTMVFVAAFMATI